MIDGMMQSHIGWALTQIWRNSPHKKRQIPPYVSSDKHHTVANNSERPYRNYPRLYDRCYRLLFYL